MRVVPAESAFDLPTPDRCVHGLLSARWGTRRGLRLLGVAAQAVAFSAVLWLLVAGPGFLSARDSLLPDRPAQASR